MEINNRLSEGGKKTNNVLKLLLFKLRNTVVISMQDIWNEVSLWFNIIHFGLRYPFHQDDLSNRARSISPELYHQGFAFELEWSYLSNSSYYNATICFCLVLEISLSDVVEPSGAFWENAVILFLCAYPWRLGITWSSKSGYFFKTHDSGDTLRITETQMEDWYLEVFLQHAIYVLCATAPFPSKHPHNKMLPIPCFTVWIMFFGLKALSFIHSADHYSQTVPFFFIWLHLESCGFFIK